MNTIRSTAGRGIRFRMGVLCGILGLGLGLVVSAGWDLMIRDGADWRQLAERQRERRLRIRPKRGLIYDRYGGAMAASIEVPTISLDARTLLRGVAPGEVPKIARQKAVQIAEALSLEVAMVERKILARRRWTWLKRRVSAEEIESIRTLKKLRGAERVLGLMIEGEPARFYPRRDLAGPLLGFVSPDGKGRDGLEYSLNHELEGQPDHLKGLRDRSGKLILDQGIEDERAFAGHNIYLTIDQGLQYEAERALENVTKTFEAKGGSVVVIKPQTGEILALASYPGFNPNDYRVSSPDQRRNRAVNDTFEPGSTMKIFTVAAGLETRLLKPTEQIYCEKGRMKIDNVTIRDTHPAGWLPVTQVLAQSSNICAAKIGLSLGGERLYEAFRDFGFGQRSGAPVPGESAGRLRPRGRPWVQVETASAAFGQGISITNLQLAMATATIANGGELMEPLIIKRVTTATGEVVRDSAPRVRRRVVSKKVARQLGEMLVAVTEGQGTGVQAALPGHRVAGKTATAQKTNPKTGRYSLDNYIASFSGFVPAEAPEIAIAVTVDSPRVSHAGGSVAAPIFRRVADYALRSQGVAPRGTQKESLALIGRRPEPARAAHLALAEARGDFPVIQDVVSGQKAQKGEVLLPNLTGKPMRYVVRELINAGVVPQIEGSGLLVQQLPAPGSVIKLGDSIRLIFKPAS